VDAGLVNGNIQSIDSAYINANASIDRMTEVKMIDRDPKDYLDELSQHDSNHQIYGHDDEKVARKRLEKSQRNLEWFTEMTVLGSLSLGLDFPE
jgi:hypothetical protein